MLDGDDVFHLVGDERLVLLPGAAILTLVPGPLADDYAEWKPAPPPRAVEPGDVFVKTPDLEGSKKGLGSGPDKKRLRVIE